MRSKIQEVHVVMLLRPPEFGKVYHFHLALLNLFLGYLGSQVDSLWKLPEYADLISDLVLARDK